MRLFAVVQNVYVVDRWQAIAEVLTESLGLHPATANQRAKRSGGFIAEQLDREMAETIHRACECCGVSTRLVPQEEIIPLPALMRIHEVWVAPNGLWVHLGHLGAKRLVNWSSIALIAACPIQRTEAFHRWSTSRSLLGGSDYRLKAKGYSKEYTELCADVFGASPDGQLMRLRLGSRELNYQEVLANIEDAPSMPEKRIDAFCLVLAQILQRALRAYVPPETRILLGDGSEPEQPLCDLSSVEEFDTYNRWLLQKVFSIPRE
jgi:hypothetical protein